MTHHEGYVLVGYDGSDDAVRALLYGAAEAVARQAELAVVYAVDDTVLNSAWGVVFDREQIKEAASQLLRGALEQAKAIGVPAERIRTEIAMGNPADALSKLSGEARLLIVGRRAASGQDRMYTGSTAVGVAAHAQCPVICISATSHEERTERRDAIGIALSSATKGGAPLHWGLAEARRTGATAKLVSVVRAPQSRILGGAQLSPEQRAQAVRVTRERIEAAAAAALSEYTDVEVEIEIPEGDPVQVLVAMSESLDLLVVDVARQFPGHAVGGLVRAVMTHSRCPVALLRDH